MRVVGGMNEEACVAIYNVITHINHHDKIMGLFQVLSIMFFKLFTMNT